MTTLGEKIRTLRKGKKMTLEELADAIGSGKSYIWELENRGVKRPSAEKLSSIAKILGVTSDYLLDESANTEIDKESATDLQFFRKYKTLDDKTKEKIQKTLEIFWDGDEQ